MRTQHCAGAVADAPAQEEAWPGVAGHALLSWLERTYPGSSQGRSEPPCPHSGCPFTGISQAIAAQPEAWRSALCHPDLGRPAAAAAQRADHAAAAAAADAAAAGGEAHAAQAAVGEGRALVKRQSSLSSLASAASHALAAMMGLPIGAAAGEASHNTVSSMIYAWP